jgi:hypothetical protein
MNWLSSRSFLPLALFSRSVFTGQLIRDAQARADVMLFELPAIMG